MNTLYYGTTAVRTGCYLGATAIVGKKLYHGIAAITLKAAADIFESSNLKMISNKYKQLTKKDFARDMKIAIALLGTGLVCEMTENSLLYRLAEIEANKPLAEKVIKYLNYLKNSPNNLYCYFFEPKKFFTEKVVDTYERTVTYFTHDFRFTPPYQESLTDSLARITKSFINFTNLLPSANNINIK